MVNPVIHILNMKLRVVITPKVSYTPGSLYSLMNNGYYKGKTDWSNWSKTKNPAYVQADLNRGASVSFVAINSANPITTMPAKTE